MGGRKNNHFLKEHVIAGLADIQRGARLFALMAAALAMLAGCGGLPRGDGLSSEILSHADARDADFAVYQVDRDLLGRLAHWPQTGRAPYYGWIRQQPPTSGPTIAPGDRINLSIWDSEENSLLTAPGQKTIAMTELIVADDGQIFVPYIEHVPVRGLSAERARQRIQQQLEAILPAAQVQLSVMPGRKNAVDLVGGVEKPGNYPLDGDHFTVLNLISLGGGVPSSLRNPLVRLIRGGRVYAISLARLYGDPSLDTSLRGGDKVIVEADSRYFLALGAANKEQIVYFPQDQLSALDAMSMIGGISDSRANPQGILILRQYPDSALGRDEKHGPGKARVVFVIDLTSADGLFSAGQFQVHPGDTVLVTESAVTAAQSVFGLIGRAFGISKNL